MGVSVDSEGIWDFSGFETEQPKNIKMHVGMLRFDMSFRAGAEKLDFHPKHIFSASFCFVGGMKTFARRCCHFCEDPAFAAPARKHILNLYIPIGIVSPPTKSKHPLLSGI